MDTTNTLGGTSPRRSSSGSNQLHTLTSASQPTLRPALGKEEIQSGTAYELYPSFPSSAKPQNMPMPTPSTSESTPHVSTTLERDNTSTLGSASPRRSSSGNQLHTPAGAGQPADPSPALGREATQGSSAYAYADFPWTAEPQNMSMPELSTPESTPHLSRTFEADSKSARRNRLQKVSNPTLAVTGQPVARLHPGSGREEIQGGSAHGNASFPQAAEPQKRPLVPMPMPSAQSRPHLSRRFSEYTAMLLALDDISVGTSSALINAAALYLRLVANEQSIYKSLRMDLVGGLLSTSCDFREIIAEYVRLDQWCGVRRDKSLASCAFVSHDMPQTQ
jgi:hypothetical protein